MSNSTGALVKTETVQVSSPMEMIQLAFNKAIEQGSALEVIDRILEQQKWMIRHNEEEAFNAALKRIQKQLKRIPKRGFNSQTNSNYALVQDVDAAIQHLLDEEGMTLTFVPERSPDPMMVIIVGTLSLGAYKREYPLPMPTDGQGPKGGGVMTRTHATGSAITYAKRYLKDMIFDLRFDDPKHPALDDDGNAAGRTAPEDVLDESVVREFLDNIEASATPDELKRNYQAAQKAGSKDASALKAFDAAKRKTWFGKGFGR